MGYAFFRRLLPLLSLCLPVCLFLSLDEGLQSFSFLCVCVCVCVC